MIGRSREFVLMVAVLRRYAACGAPVLLEGETGTGKELAAREIHYAGPRRDKPFVPLNCGAIPDSLVESELFGHRRGAFTDAKTAQPGMIDRAGGGTLFLDEVDSLSPKAQVTLLRFLQDREYRPVGGGPVRAADVRVIAAANSSLQSLVADARFRGDLYYRLNPLYVRLPPLRDRGGDVALLADHFLDLAARRLNVAAKRWSGEALRALTSYAWPGNVRELENVTLRACLGTEGLEVGLAELATAEPAMLGHRVAHETAAHNASTFRTPTATSALTSDRFSVAKASAIESFERHYLMELMRRTAGNVSAAARLSCVERRQLGKLLKKRGIETRQFRSGE
jgi:DNA-binding NtrC family response regulator